MTEQTTIDWKTLEAGRSLDWAIATILGYRTEIVEQTEYGSVHLVGPDNKPVGYLTFTAIFKSETEARQSKYIPPWSTDLNAAVTLLPLVGGEFFTWNLRNSSIDLTYICEINDFTRQRKGEADTPALAVARAFLAWKESENR